jgi:1-hydroxycarotenoid 3,4-desaturase
MTRPRIAVIGAGVGGLAAAADLSRAGFEVSVFERAPEPGGKMRQVSVGGMGVDAGPTVFTMRWVFDHLFGDAGASLEQMLALHPAPVLARHAWTGGGTLDLHPRLEDSMAAIAEFAGEEDARGYGEFCRRSGDIYATLRDSFMTAQRPGPFSLARRIGLSRPLALWRTAPYLSLWRALDRHFRDPRLRQLFGRYATYVGSSPLQAPATLMLIAHVEQSGVWLVDGGMRALASALQRLGERQGASYHFDREVREIRVERGSASGLLLADGEQVAADYVVFNGDISALGTGLLGGAARDAAPVVTPRQRGLSAVTWCLRGSPRGFPLHYHNVFFDRDYESEFTTLFRERDVVARPTVYVCAQDRLDGTDPGAPERLLVLINAPADGDSREWPPDLLEALRERAFRVLSACGLAIDFDEEHCQVTSPVQFAGLFPGSGGSLYGRASHGMFSSFVRPGARSRLPRLYLAGGSVHPGPGVPMAALSGRLAAAAIGADIAGGNGGR